MRLNNKTKDIIAATGLMIFILELIIIFDLMR